MGQNELLEGRGFCLVFSTAVSMGPRTAPGIGRNRLECSLWDVSVSVNLPAWISFSFSRSLVISIPQACNF